jgi:glycosyltransferase 2 family protein
MLRRLATSRWVRLALLAVALGFCCYGLVAQRAEATAALHDLAWGPVIAAVSAAIAGLGCLMLAWRAVLRDLGSPLPLRAVYRIYFIGQLGKYVPGALWATAAQVELARGYAVPRKRSASAAVISMLVTLATGLLVAAVALPLSSGHAARVYWWALVLAPPALICLSPAVTGRALNWALRLAKRPPLERPISRAGMARAVAWSLLGWVFFSVHMWLLVADLTGRGVSVLPIAAGAYALAWCVGFILIPFPGGVGPRELAIIVALAPVMPRGSAIVVAVVSRLVLTAADLLWAAVAFPLGRGLRRDLRHPPDRGGPPPRALAQLARPRESGAWDGTGAPQSASVREGESGPA